MINDNNSIIGKENKGNLDTPKTEEKMEQKTAEISQEVKPEMPKRKKNIIRVYHAQNASDGGKKRSADPSRRPLDPSKRPVRPAGAARPAGTAQARPAGA
ncbi:MAG: hypothetical protein HUJ72_05295, partial [Blautia sp.]|nr:hypothetical protein [Blautia sp.]